MNTNKYENRSVFDGVIWKIRKGDVFRWTIVYIFTCLSHEIKNAFMLFMVLFIRKCEFFCLVAAGWNAWQWFSVGNRIKCVERTCTATKHSADINRYCHWKVNQVSCVLLLSRPTTSKLEGLKLNTWTFFLFLFYQYIEVKSETNLLCSHDCSMSLPSLMKLGPHTPQNRLIKVLHPIKSKVFW